MNNILRILVLVSAFLGASPAFAACTGQFLGGTLCGNNTALQGIPGPTANPVLGVPGINTGTLGFAGSSSGTALVSAQASAGAATLLLPTTSGTLADSASSPLVLNATTGVLTCPTCVTGTSGAITNGTTPTSGYTTGQIIISDGSVVRAVTPAAGQILAGSSPAFTATPTLGASGTVGTISFGNATSGTVTLGTVTGVLGSVTAQLPANSGILAELNFIQTWTATQTFPNNSLTLAEFPTIGANTVIGSIAGGTPAALSQTQLTSLINVATASLSGAIPAWPNNTTTFFRGDGTYAVPSSGSAPFTIGQFVIGTLASQDAFTVHGQQNFYFPAIASDSSCFCNTFIGNGGTSLTHAIVNTNSPGVSATATVTITIAAPGVVTWTASNFAQDTPVAFTTTGTLPTGIVSGTTYYVARSPAPTANTFSIAATVGGGAITTSGSQSGTQSGYTISLEGRYNISVGQQALLAIINGSYNTGAGFETFFHLTDGSWNTAWGEGALFTIVHGNANAAFGWKALLQSVDNSNSAFGYGSMLNYVGTVNTSGANVAVGYSSLNGAASATFTNVTGIGFGVGGVLSSGHDLVLAGTSTASAATTLSNSVIIGSGAGANLTNPTGETFVGDHTGGGVITGSNNTLIGANQTGLSSSLANEIRLSDGNGALGFRSDSSRNTYLGDSSTGKNVYNYFATNTNNAGTTADSSGVWHVFTGTAGTANWLNIYPDGSVTIGTPTGANEGAGTLNLQGNLFNNGTAPTGTGGYVRAINPTFAALVNNGLTDISGASGGQIKFPSSQNVSADAHTLDDYAEATFTPTLTFGGASVGVTYGSQVGNVTKIGRQVTAMGSIILTSKGSSTGGASVVTGLSYLSVADAPCSVQINNFNATTITTVQAQISGSSSAVGPSKYAAGTNTPLADTDFTNTSVFKFACTYMTSS